MAAVLRKRPCRFCRRWFLPNARLGDRQYACSEPSCQARRQGANESSWLAGHPSYLAGRAQKRRLTRSAESKAKRAWRAARPEVRERERLARSQSRTEEATRRAVRQKAIVLELVDEQGVTQGLPSAVRPKSIVPQLHVLLGLASALHPAVRPKAIAGALEAWEVRGRRLLVGAHRHEPSPPRREAPS